MGWYRRCSRFVFDAFRRHNSKNTTITRNPIHANTFSLTPSNPVRSRIYQFPSSSPPPLLRNWVFQHVFKNSSQRNYTPFRDGAKRFYRMERNTVQESEPFTRKRWSQNPKTVIMVSYGVVMTAYFLNTEIVPYTKRAQVVLLPSAREKRLSDSWFEEIKSKYEEKILPPQHPQSIRAQKVAQNLIKAQKELRREPQRVVLPHVVGKEETVMRRTRNWMINLLSELTKTRNRVIDSVNKLGPQTAGSDGFKWEVIVVKEPIVYAYCMPSGKIVVFSGLLDYFKEDGEVAAILGHEVGHAVARHHAEKFSNNYGLLGILDFISYQRSNIYAKDERAFDQEKLAFDQRMEMEADYIGRLLMASAGYDPRVASRVWERLGSYGCKLKNELPLLQKYVAIHPCGKERSELLSHPKLMEDALSVYGSGVEAERRLVM